MCEKAKCSAKAILFSRLHARLILSCERMPLYWIASKVIV